MHITIRPETIDDIDQISRVLQEAFRDNPFSRNNEHRIVAALRKGGALLVGLVSEEHGQVVGHIAFSPVLIDGNDHRWFGLGPLAVVPHRQKQGIGQRLVEAGFQSIRKLNAAGCVVLGDPAYYSKFGFASNSNLIFEGVPAEYFMALSFDGQEPEGKVKYHAAFYESNS